MQFLVGCHVSASGGVFNAPKNAYDLNCETFQIFTRPPMGGPAPKIGEADVEKFKAEMEKYYPLPSPPHKGEGTTAYSSSLMGEGRWGCEFVVHAPYIVNFGSSKKTTFHGSISIVSEELVRANLLGAKYVMTHLGSFKDLGQEKGMRQAKEGLKQVLEKYGEKAKKPETQFLLEISAGQGETIGDTFEELAELMEPLKKFEGFGGICMDTQHAFSSGYDLRDSKSVLSTFTQFEKVIGLKWLKMSHINDSKIDLGGRKDRHEHIQDGKIGEKGFKALLDYWSGTHLKGGKNKEKPMLLILETEHDKVETDIKILKKLRDKISK